VSRGLGPWGPLGRTPDETCGNEYDEAFTITMGGDEHILDAFERAIQALAPQRVHCGGRVLGHGVEEGERTLCCAHCAHAMGVEELRDRA
jgi:hypothetical protein